MSEYLIWSNEHRAWWAPGRCGYVQSFRAAGTYTRAEAIDICSNAIPGTSLRIGALPEIPVRQEDVRFMAESFRTALPDVAKEFWE